MITANQIAQARSLVLGGTGGQISLAASVSPGPARRRVYLGWFINPDPGSSLTTYGFSGELRLVNRSAPAWAIPIAFDRLGTGNDLNGPAVTNGVIPGCSVRRLDANAGWSLQDLDLDLAPGQIGTVFHVPEVPYDWMIGLRCSPIEVESDATAVEFDGLLQVPVVGTFSYGFFLAVASAS